MFIVLRVFKNNTTLRLSFSELKWLVKCYWKVENVVEVHQCSRVELDSPPPTRVIITRTRDKFEVVGGCKMC
jgi:hypothetical protein